MALARRSGCGAVRSPGVLPTATGLRRPWQGRWIISGGISVINAPSGRAQAYSRSTIRLKEMTKIESPHRAHDSVKSRPSAPCRSSARCRDAEDRLTPTEPVSSPARPVGPEIGKRRQAMAAAAARALPTRPTFGRPIRASGCAQVRDAAARSSRPRTQPAITANLRQGQRHESARSSRPALAWLQPPAGRMPGSPKNRDSSGGADDEFGL